MMNPHTWRADERTGIFASNPGRCYAHLIKLPLGCSLPKGKKGGVQERLGFKDE